MQLILPFLKCRFVAAFSIVFGMLANSVMAQTLAEGVGVGARPHLSMNGTPGLIDMPSARMMPDGDFALSLSDFGATSRSTLAFQINPRLLGVFRYSRISNFDQNQITDTRFDRSFELVYQLMKEGTYRPSLAVGLRDFGGTGLLGSEYIVATKALPAQRWGKLEFTAGMGWGRLGSQEGFTNPLGAFGSGFETRPSREVSITNTGRFRAGDLFRGDAALFAGVSWAPNDRWTFVGEYSSDAYDKEAARGLIDRKTSFNFGANYKVSRAVNVGLYSLYGSEIGVKLDYAINPQVPPAANGLEPGPLPIAVRPTRQSAPAQWSTAWAGQQAQIVGLRAKVAQQLAVEGLLLEEFETTPTSMRVSLRNRRFDQSAQAVGRAARALAAAAPASVESFEIVLIKKGVPTTSVTLRRSDLEELEFEPDNIWKSYVRAEIEDAGTAPAPRRSLTTPRLTYGIAPYASPSYFDPNQPILLDIGAEGSFRYELQPSFFVAGSVRQPILTNRDSTNRVSNSVLPFVRSEGDDFSRGYRPQLTNLYGAKYFRPGPDLYGRVTAGYLELAYAGVSGELLWKPVDSRLALGIEINAVHQRSPGEPFRLGTGVFDNDAITGHASAYYSFENGFHTQLDVGRYLAGDWGGTFTLTREFRNGWEVGAFATLTDVSFEDFGEGSFDKGIFFTIPTSWSVGQPNRNKRSTTLRPVTRDGGARVGVPGRLYETIREDSTPYLEDSWGRFWR